MKKRILFTLLSVMFIFLLAPIIQVKAETSIVDIEGGTEKAQSTEISTESKGAELSGSEQAFYIDDNGSLHVAEKEDTTSFFNRMYKNITRIKCNSDCLYYYRYYFCDYNCSSSCCKYSW